MRAPRSSTRRCIAPRSIFVSAIYVLLPLSFLKHLSGRERSRAVGEIAVGKIWGRRSAAEHAAGGFLDRGDQFLAESFDRFVGQRRLDRLQDDRDGERFLA